MDIRNVFTESAEQEQWGLLQQFTYTENIKRFLSGKGVSPIDEKLVELISGSILQAKEYFDASKNSSLHISPLLLYYGISNLLNGVASLKLGTSHAITDHGMQLEYSPDKNKIAEAEIKPRNMTTGALSVFEKVFSGKSPIHGSGSWKLIELLGSVPDLRDDFLTCYPGEQSYMIPLHVVKEKGRSLEKIDLKDMPAKDISALLLRVEGFKENYLEPQSPQNGTTIILRQKINGKEIGVYSLSGIKYLPVAHFKNSRKITLDLITTIFMASFSLGYLCRYRPEIWTPFLRSDTTGERLLVERFIKLSHRLLPNLVLDFILEEKVRFVQEPQGVTDLSSVYTKEELSELVREEIRKKMDEERFRLK